MEEYESPRGKIGVIEKRVCEEADRDNWGDLTKAIERLKELGAAYSLTKMDVSRDKHWIKVHSGEVEMQVGYLLDELKHQLHEATKETRHQNALNSFLYRVDRTHKELERQEREEAQEQPDEDEST